MGKRLFLSDTDKIIAGVCGGIAKYFNIDPVIVRLIWGGAMLIYGTGFALYLLFWIVVPREHNV